MVQKSGIQRTEKPIIEGDAIVIRLERDGFGIIQDKNSQRYGVFTLQTTKFDPKELRARYRTLLGTLWEGRVTTGWHARESAKAKALVFDQAKATLREGMSVRFIAEETGDLLNVTKISRSK